MVDIPSVLKEVMDSSSQLSGWALAIVGGSVGVIVSTSYRRPKSLYFRLPYLLFVPGWICIAISLYLGNKIVGKYLASLMVHQEQISNIASQVNDIYADQRVYLLYSLVFFGLWLLIFLLSWIFMETFSRGREKMNKVMFALLFSFSAPVVSSTECDCSNYPFKPNPPCYGICVANLSSSNNIDLTDVKNIDPGVAVGIKVISESKFRETTNFRDINKKADLEREALRLINYSSSER